MDSNTIFLVIGIIGCIVGIAGWLYTRDNKKTDDAEWKGTVNAKLDICVGIQTDVKNLKNITQDHETRIKILEKESERK